MCQHKGIGHSQEPIDAIKTIPDLLENVPNYSDFFGVDFGIGKDKSVIAFWEIENGNLIFKGVKERNLDYEYKKTNFVWCYL